MVSGCARRGLFPAGGTRAKVGGVILGVDHAQSPQCPANISLIGLGELLPNIRHALRIDPLRLVHPSFWNLQGPFLLGRWTISFFCFFPWTLDYIFFCFFLWISDHIFFLLPFGITDYFSFSPASGLCIIFVMFRLPLDPNFLRCSHLYIIHTKLSLYGHFSFSDKDTVA